jgi:DNA modification methylase
MDDQALRVLAEDIEKHGIQEPVMLFENKVLDGRNRLRACKLNGLRLTSEYFETFKPNGLSSREFVFTRNLRRRHLTIDQRAALAAELVPEFRKEASKRIGGRPRQGAKPSAKLRGVSGKAAEHAARFVGNGGVSARYVEMVLSLEKKKPGTMQRIKAGKISIQEAKREVDALYSPRPLTEQFVLPPFTVLDARQGYWTKRKDHWIKEGVPKTGHNEQLQGGGFGHFGHKERFLPTSAFDPVLAEFVYKSYCPKGGRVLDPFAGECVKGIVAEKLGLDYTGIELRETQVKENRTQARRAGVTPAWLVGDSSEISALLGANKQFDLIFTSPPYYDLEIYSKHERDGSAFESYPKFIRWYEHIFQQVIGRLKPNRFLVVKVGEVRDEKGFYRNFVGDNISCFLRLGLRYYNEAILIMSAGSAALRAKGQFPKSRKLVKCHQNVLFFFKGGTDKAIPEELGVLKG